MIDILHFYVTFLCPLSASCEGFSAPVKQVLQSLGGGYAIPAGLALLLLVFWFGGLEIAVRTARQRVVLRGLVAALIAWGLAVSTGFLWQQAVSGLELERAVGGWACWQGLPSACTAAAVGFALGAALWRRNWRWGAVICLVTGLRIAVQMGCGFCYPLDVAVGTVLGVALGWWLGGAAWLDRPLGIFIRLARRLMLA